MKTYQRLVKSIGKEKADELMAEVEHYERTGIPRCTTCKKNMIQESKHSWKHDCKCCKTDLRLMIG